MQIRRYRPGEEAALWKLYADTTRWIIAPAYTPEQIKRWAPENPDRHAWVDKLARTNPIVAIVDDRLVGFAELEPEGVLASLYCHHRWQRRGIGTALLEVVEAEAAQAGIGVLSAEVNTTALGFFRARGFEIIEQRSNWVCEAVALQFLMRKHLSPQHVMASAQPTEGAVPLREN